MNHTKSNAQIKGELRYFLERSSNIIYDFLVGEGDAKDRLRKNEMELRFMLYYSIPESLTSLQQEIINKLTKESDTIFEDKIITTSFLNSINSMRNSTASKVISNFYHLKNEVEAYNESLEY